MPYTIVAGIHAACYLHFRSRRRVSAVCQIDKRAVLDFRLRYGQRSASPVESTTAHKVNGLYSRRLSSQFGDIRGAAPFSREISADPGECDGVGDTAYFGTASLALF